MNMLSFSSCFPSAAEPTQGIFVLDYLKALPPQVRVEVVHPVARCPVLGSLHSKCTVPSTETISGIKVHHLPYWYLPGVLKRLDARFYQWGLQRWFESYAASFRPDVLDIHFAWPDGVGASYLARRLHLPYVITLRGTIVPRYKKRCFRGRLADALVNASAVISVSHQMADIAIELGTHPGKVHVIRPAVDIQTFHTLDRQQTRQELGLEQNKPLLVCVAHLKKPKGQEDLLHAMKHVDGDARLVFIGAPADRRSYLRRLHQLADSPSLRGRVAFLGVLPRVKVVKYFNAADLSVLPSHSEGCPNVVLESLACGTPVVACDVGEIPMLIRPGESGFVVPAGNPQALREAISSALSIGWSRNKIHLTVANRSWKSVAQDALAVFQEVFSH